MYRNKLLSSILILSLMTGCTQENSNTTTYDVGVVVYDADDTFLLSITNKLEEMIDSDTSMRMTLNGAQRSQTTENSIVDDMIDEGVDILCVNLVDRTDTSYIINAAKDANVPIIFFNREPVLSDLKRWSSLYYVGADASESGRLQGLMIASYLKEHPQVDKNNDGVIQYYIYEGEVGHQDAIVRSETATDALIDSGYKIEKIGYSICNWSRSEAKKVTEELIQNESNIELMISNNDDMAAGIVDAYDEEKIDESQRAIIAGIDGTEIGLKLVDEGKMIGTVYHDANKYAQTMYNLCKAIQTNSDMSDISFTSERTIYLPYQTVTKDNLNQYKTQD